MCLNCNSLSTQGGMIIMKPFETRLVKVSSGYGFGISKKLIQYNVLDFETDYVIKVEGIEPLEIPSKVVKKSDRAVALRLPLAYISV